MNSFEDASAGHLPPIVSFGDPLEDPPPNRAPKFGIGAVRAALADLDTYSSMARRAEGWNRISALAADQAIRLSTWDVPLPVEPEPRSAVQQYFRIRTAPLSGDQALWYCLRVMTDAASDLADSPVCGSDLQRVSAAMSAVLRRYTLPTPSRSSMSSSDPSGPDRPDEEVWHRRWIIGHQLHAMLNVHAAYSVAEATSAIRRNEFHAAASALVHAAEIVKGFAAARALALAVPAAFYQDVLRPSMLPPLTAVPLSGRMHTEYGGYRRRVDELLKVLPQPGAQLAASQPWLAIAREQLLDADLIEAERHVTSVEPLVGDSRSLIQSSKSVDNAVSALRKIRHRRAAHSASFLRYPDVVIEGTAICCDGSP